ncbi:hypothetical protein Tco_1186833, partial [Tanacetum coccineum]
MHDPEVSNPVVTSKYVNDEDMDPKERKAKIDILNLHQDHVARISRARCRPELILCRNGVYKPATSTGLDDDHSRLPVLELLLHCP